MIKTKNDNDNSKNKQKIMENKTKEENKIQSSQVLKLETQNIMPNLPSTQGQCVISGWKYFNITK